MSSYDYQSAGLKKFDNLDAEGYYISHSFLDKLTLHLTKNFMNLPKIKVPLILGIWGGKGQGKTFQCDLVYKKLGVSAIVMSAGELESGNAGEPAKLVRQRYREASDIVKKGKMASLFINDLVRSKSCGDSDCIPNVHPAMFTHITGCASWCSIRCCTLPAGLFRLSDGGSPLVGSLHSLIWCPLSKLRRTLARAAWAGPPSTP